MYPHTTALSTQALCDETDTQREAAELRAMDDLTELLGIENITPEIIEAYMGEAHGEIWDSLNRMWSEDAPFHLEKEGGELPVWFRPGFEPAIVF